MNAQPALTVISSFAKFPLASALLVTEPSSWSNSSMQNCRVHSLILGADETVQTTFINKRWVKSAGNSIWRCRALTPLGCAVLFTRGAMGSILLNSSENPKHFFGMSRCSNKEMALDRCLTHQTLTRGLNC